MLRKAIIVYTPTQKWPSGEKGCGSMQNGLHEKVVKNRWWPVMVGQWQNSNNDNSGEFLLPYPSFTRNWHQIHLK